MNKKNLKKFVNNIQNFNKLKHASRILWLGYYLQNNESYDFFNSADIQGCYGLLDLPAPSNLSDSIRKLKDAKKLVKNKTGFRVAKEEGDRIQSILQDKINFNANNRLEKVYSPGDSYDFYDDVKKIIEKATSEVFLIDSYATEDIINLYLNKFPKGIRITILTNKPQGNFVSIATKFKLKHGKNFSVKTNKNCHDRVFFVDKKCYTTGQSLDKAASKQPTYLCEIVNSGSFRNVFQKLFDLGRTLL